MNRKGFVFIETIIVTALLLSALMLIYSSFISTNNTETRRLRYDDPVKLYETFYIKKYLESFDLSAVKANATSKKYAVIYRSEQEIFGNSFLAEKTFFEKLYERTNIENIYLFPYNVSDMVTLCDGTDANQYPTICTNNNLVSYLRTLDISTITNDQSYRLVIEYAQQLNGEKCSSGTSKDCFYFYSSVKVAE